jgi:hypothetical protein
MGSTMALDAAILGKPSCYINYDVKSDYNWSVKRTYRFIHFNMIKDIDPVFWIKDRNRIYEELNNAMKNVEAKKQGRHQWVARATKLPIEDTIPRMWKFLKETYEV